MTPSWVDVVEHVGTPLSGILLYVLGRASKGGANQLALDEACRKIDSMEKLLVQHGEILAAHTTLHKGYVEMQRDTSRIDRMVSLICGKLGIGLGRDSGL